MLGKAPSVSWTQQSWSSGGGKGQIAQANCSGMEDQKGQRATWVLWGKREPVWVIWGDLTDRRHGKSATDGTAMGPGRD